MTTPENADRIAGGFTVQRPAKLRLSITSVKIKFHNLDVQSVSIPYYGIICEIRS